MRFRDDRSDVKLLHRRPFHFLQVRQYRALDPETVITQYVAMEVPYHPKREGVKDKSMKLEHRLTNKVPKWRYELTQDE